MVEEQKKTLDTESPANVPAPVPAPVPTPAPAAPAAVAKDVTEEKIEYPPVEKVSDDSKALAIVESKFSLYLHIIMDCFLR